MSLEREIKARFGGIWNTIVLICCNRLSSLLEHRAG
jgi:hypothetical protein